MSKNKREKKVHFDIKKANKILKKAGCKYRKGALIRTVKGTEKEISDFIIIPVRRIRTVVDGKEIYYIELKVFSNSIDQGIKLVESTEIEKSNFINKYWGGICNIYPDGGGYKYILFALKLLLVDTELVVQYAKIGWQKTEENRMCFVHGGGIIGVHDSKYLIHNNIKKFVLNTTDANEVEVFKFFMKLLKVANPEITYPLISHLIVGLLFQLFEESNHEIDFILMLSGHTGSLKTTLAYLTCNIFNKGGKFKHGSFSDTVNDMEMFVNEMRSCVSILDDIHPSTDPKENRNLEFKAQRIIRNVGDGNGKGRLGRDLKRQAKYNPQGAVLFTGEDVLSGASTLARMYTVNMTRNEINFKWLDYIQKDERIISTFVYNFLEWIAHKYNDVVDFICERYFGIKKEIFQELKDEEFHYRKPSIYISYMIGFELLTNYGIEIGAIKENKVKKKLKKAKEVFISGIKKQYEEVSSNDPVNMYLRTINELIAANKAIIAPIGKEVNDQRLIGYDNKEHIFLLPDVAYNKVYQFWRSRNQSFPIKMQKLSETLYNVGLTEVEYSDDGIKYHKKKSVSNGYRIRVLYIKKAAMKNYMKNRKSKKQKKRKKKEYEMMMEFIESK